MLQATEYMEGYSSSGSGSSRDETKERGGASASATTRPNESGGGIGSARAFHSFAPKAQGVLFKISPLSDQVSGDIETYMRGGAMQRDLAFVDTLYGIVAPSQSREYNMFWESPWVEEQIKEMGKKRKVVQQQRTMAVRSFIKATTAAQESAENVDRFLNTVDRLTEWDKQTDGEDTIRESVKTVSRMVQSFEKKSIMNLLSILQAGKLRNPVVLQHIQRLRGTETGDIDVVAHSLRRSQHTYVAFATLVAAELVMSEANSGTKNVSINTARRMEFERSSALSTMLDVLQQATASSLPRDTIGLPLMHTNAHVCISKGVLVVASRESTQATYILEIENLDVMLQKRPRRGNKELDFIEIRAQIFDEEDASNALGTAQQPHTGRPPNRKKGARNSQPQVEASVSRKRPLASLVPF